jgi:3'-5' exoribonuclease
MPEKVFVKDLVVDTRLNTTLLLAKLETRQKKNGEEFLSLALQDRTGSVGAVMWDNVAVAQQEVKEGDYVQVVGKISQYNDRLQVTVEYLKRVDPDSVDPGDYLPATGNSIPAMWDAFMAEINNIGNLALRRLILSIFEDGETVARFKRAPAAKGNHHNVIGGLLEHTLSMITLCAKVADHYPAVLDRDLLITGGILHDLAKIDELSYERQFDYTDEGRLLGHIVMGANDLDRRMRDLEFPDRLRIKVLHMIISHHGEEQFGSPRKPMTAEAIALHHIDMIDSRMEMVRAAIADAGPEGSFTPFNRALEVYIYKG